MGDLEIPANYGFLEEYIIFGFHLMGEIFERLHNKQYRVAPLFICT